MFSPLTFSLIFAAIGAAGFASYVILKYKRHKLLQKDLGLKLLSVRLPLKESESQNNEPLSEIAYSAQLLSVLAKENSPLILEVAVHNVGEEISFYVAVPDALIEFAMRQIHGLWGDAQVEIEKGDYTIFHPKGDVAAGVLSLKDHYALPIRTFNDAAVDTFAPILSNFSKLNTVGEGLALQLIVKTAPKSAKKTILGFINKLRKGESLEDLTAGVFKKVFALKGKEDGGDKDKAQDRKMVDEETVKALEQKISKPLFAVNLRIVASAPTPFRAAELLDNLAGSFAQFESPTRNSMKITKLRDPKKEIFKFVFREFDNGEAVVLNSDEITSMFHFPISTTDIPRIKFVKAREAPPPVTLPKAGVLVGESVFRGDKKPVYISDDDRRRHIYVIGQTGTGKSELLRNMVIADIVAGKGVAIIDPHGDLVETILANIPENRFEDVIIFDPGDRVHPLGLNMLEYDPNFPEQKTFIVNEMQGIFNKLFAQETMGPMFEQYMRNALLLLMEDSINEPATLMEVPRIFTDAEFRKQKISRIHNPTVIDFWEKEAVKAGGEASLANMTPYITSKFNNFIANDYVRPIIGQIKSAFNFRKVMDEGKILLVNLSKGRIGDINAGLLGMVLVGKLLMAALSRVDIPQPEKRRDFNLYIDEFQNFATDSISTILSEARKYRLNLVIAHQFIAQLQEKIRDAVFGNVGSMVVFRVGTEDAEFLAKQFEPVFNKSDLMNIDNFNAYVKLLISGATTKPFNIRTLKAPSGEASLKEKLKDISRQKFGADLREIEEDILKRLRG